VLSSSVRQRRTTAPRDLPYGEKPLAVRWHKVQYACRETACSRRASTEQITGLPARAGVTGRLRRHVAARVGDPQSVSVACAGLMGRPAANAPFIAAAEEQLVDPAPVAVLGIDETRRGRPRWTRAEHDRWGGGFGDDPSGSPWRENPLIGWEPPVGIEPTTFSLRVRCSTD
jgi:transposase